MILAAFLVIEQPAQCTFSNRWTVVESGTEGPSAFRQAEYKNRIRLRGGTSWNGVTVDDATLRIYADRAARIDPTPLTVLDGYRTDCARLQHYAALLEAAAVCTRETCLVDFNPPAPPPPPPPMPVDEVRRR